MSIDYIKRCLSICIIISYKAKRTNNSSAINQQKDNNNSFITMSSNDPRKIVEDAPTMMSVAISSSPTMMMPRSLISPKMPSAVLLREPSIKLYSSSPATLQKQQALPDFGDLTCFPRLPVGYLLERTHVRINDASLEEVTSRVSAILVHESVATVYDINEVS